MIQPRTRAWTLALALAAIAAPQGALADDRADFQARYAQLKAAMETRAPEQIKPLLTPDFAASDISGRAQDADAMIDRLAMIPVDPDHKQTTTVDSVTIAGDTAQVVQHLSAGGMRQGRDGQTHTMAFDTVSHDTWLRGPSGWLLKATETEEMTITRDGQVMRHMKQGDPMPEGGWRGRGGRGRDGERGRGRGMSPPPGGSSPDGDAPPPSSDED
jgi:ketosteroid isomerase-like protein